MDPFSPHPEEYRDYLKAVASSRIIRQFAIKADVSDVVQETLLRACSSAGKFQGSTEQEYRGWLRAILQNVCLGTLRRFRADKRDARLEQSLQQALHTSSCRVEHFLSAVQTTPGEQCMRADAMQRVLTAIDRLPDDQRMAVQLHHVEGMSLNEVATELRKTKASVAGLLRRGLQTLRAALSQN